MLALVALDVSCKRQVQQCQVRQCQVQQCQVRQCQVRQCQVRQCLVAFLSPVAFLQRRKISRRFLFGLTGGMKVQGTISVTFLGNLALQIRVTGVMLWCAVFGAETLIGLTSSGEMP